jgi:hypothetical protein
MAAFLLVRSWKEIRLRSRESASLSHNPLNRDPHNIHWLVMASLQIPPRFVGDNFPLLKTLDSKDSVRSGCEAASLEKRVPTFRKKSTFLRKYSIRLPLDVAL